MKSADIGITFRFIRRMSALSMLTGILHAQDIAAVDVAARSAQCLLPANTEVHLRLVEPVASNTHKHGDRFSLEVVEPVVVDGATIIPSGARAGGEVVHAAKGGFGGRSGELILASRFITIGDQTVRLRSFSAGSGKDRVNLAMGLSFVVVGIFVTGKDISLPAGTDVFAKVAADTLLSVADVDASAPVDNVAATNTPASPSPMPDRSSSATHDQSSTSAADLDSKEMNNNEHTQQ